MSFASDKLYNDYLRRNLARFVSKVKVKEILPHLPCLTQSDREEIEAKREQHGNYDAMQLLLSNLTRREHWAEEFISALESCEHRALADEIRTKYNSYKTPSVVQARVPPPPPANPALPVPESTEDRPGAGAPTPQRAAPPASAQAPPPPSPQAPPPPSPPVMPVTPPSPAPPAAMAAEPAPVPRPPATPDVARRRPSPPPDHAPPEVPGDEVPIPGNAALAPDRRASDVPSGSQPPGVRAETPASSQADQVQPAHEEVSRPQSAAPVQPDPASVAETPSATTGTTTTTTPETTTTTETTGTTETTTTTETTGTTETTAETTPAPANSALEKHPVQDTTPPHDAVPPAPQQPVEHSDPTAQVTENDELAEPPLGDVSQHGAQSALAPSPHSALAPSPPVDSVDGADSTLSDGGEDGYLSKPGVLNSLSEEPFSGNVSLQISTSASVPEPAALAPMTTACSADPEPSAVDNPSPCQENGLAEEALSLYDNEPEENLFESSCQSSLGDQEVLTNVIQVSEEPSVQNLAGQTVSTPANAVREPEDPDLQTQITLSGAVSGSDDDDLTESSPGNAAWERSQDSPSQILNGRATKQLACAPPPGCAVSISVTSAPSKENSVNLMEDEATLNLTPQGQEDPRDKGTLPLKNHKNYMLLTAAAVGVSALFVAWKLKN